MAAAGLVQLRDGGKAAGAYGGEANEGQQEASLPYLPSSGSSGGGVAKGQPKMGCHQSKPRKNGLISFVKHLTESLVLDFCMAWENFTA